MGIFRMLLALAVLLAHVRESIGESIFNRESLHLHIWSGHAVFAFFIISGFYMSLVLDSRYLKLTHGIRSFYKNRSLRLYPVQILLLIAYALVFYYWNKPSFIIFNNGLSIKENMLAVLANATLIGTDILAMQNRWELVLGPVWSLSIEIYFYILAPFIVGLRNRHLAAFLLIMLVFRLSLSWAGVTTLPWRYFYFPSVLCFFLIGCFSYRLYKHFQNLDTNTLRLLGSLGLTLLIGSVITPLLWENNGEHDSLLSWCFYAIVALCTPLAFHLTRRSIIDRIIGQMAYPVYLSHMLVIHIVLLNNNIGYDPGVVVLFTTLTLSYGVYLLIDKNIDKLK